VRALLLALLLAGPAAEPPLAVTDVTVIDATGAPPRAGWTVLVRDGRIAGLGPAGVVTAPAGARRLDGAGKFLIPGLWDMHVHLAVAPEPRLAEDVMLPLLVRHGVVGVRDMGGDFDRIQGVRAAIAAGTLVGPRIVAPGPFVDGPQDASATVVPVRNGEEARAAVRGLKARGVDFVKVQAGLSKEAWQAVGEESRRLGLPFAGHVPDAVSASEVPGSGQRTVEHVSPALPGDAALLFACSRREAELRAELLALTADTKATREARRARRRALQAALLDGYDETRAQALFGRLKAEGVAVVPTLVWSRTQLPQDEADLGAGVPLGGVPKEMADAWATQRRQAVAGLTPDAFALFRRIDDHSRRVVGALHRAGVRLLAGTDSFDAFVVPGFALHQELELLVQAGLTPMEALQAATREPARFLGLEAERGTIEVGKAADLVLLEADPLADIRNTRRIGAVVLGGRVVP
jgi:hypothetical protein